MPFGSLWIPVLVSAVAVFLASSVLHMVIKHHRADHQALPDEAGVAAALRKAGPAPGVYSIPHCTDMNQMKDAAFAKRYTDGPVAMMVVWPNALPNMGKYLGLWFLYCVFVSFVTAYVARNTLAFGADGMKVLQITGAVAWAGYTLGYFQDSIWKGVPWSNTIRFVIDGTIYAVVTAVCFKLLWPGA